MNRIIFKYLCTGILSLILITGCRKTVTNSGKATLTAVPVTVSPLENGRMSSYIDLSAKSAFLFKAAVKAPVTGYIENMQISQGDAVKNSSLLFTIKTKEASAIIDDSVGGLKFKGIVNVNAAVAGLISSIEHPRGDYVAEGDQLCQIAIPESFVFILDIPYEVSGSIKLNTRCEIVLPDGHLVDGIIKSRFPSMESSSQTERFIVKLTESINLPENLIAKVRIIKETIDKAVSLPKSSILADETLQNFWVMKLINDSTAVKVPVTTGINDKDNVQIKMPVFKDTDLFLSSGNFGLGDTANVKVIKTLSHEQ
jgi:multidrug efflux pump subunit AcrA (membrane-fusion protein)